MPRPPRTTFMGVVRRLFYWAIVLGIWAAIGVGGIIVYYGAHLPPTSEWAVPKRPPNVKIVGIDGALIGNRGDTGGEVVKLKEMSKYIPEAVMAIEDRRFYSHWGVDPIGLVRAFTVNLGSKGLVQGGSTLTQQLAKNLFLTPERHFGRKVQELILSFWLEKTYTKDQILEMYLNRVYMGAGAYGVDAAARRYFGKSAKDVSLMEAAMLGGLLKAPSRYAPTRNPDLAKQRASVVLQAMVDSGYISAEERKAALDAPNTIMTHPNAGAENYVADWVMDILPSYVGALDKDITVETTVDGSLQILAEAALQTALLQYGDKKDVSQGALVAIDPTGGVKALIGGIDYSKSQFNRAVQAKRQPGSTFKVFTYLTAMEQGLTPDTIRPDEPFSYKGWSPKNFEKEYKGPIALKDALAQSINTVAARLAVEVGPKKVADTAMRMGITSAMMPTPSIALGTSEVTPLEITGAYVPFSNGGYGVVPHVIERIRSADGKVLYERKGSGPGRVLDPVPLAEMNVMLQETLISGTGKKAALPGWPSGAKSGTSQDFRDAWFIGYTGLLTTGVWLGNDDGTPTKRATGGSLASIVWHRFMTDALRGKHPVPIPGADGRVDPNAVPAALQPVPVQPGQPDAATPMASGQPTAPSPAPNQPASNQPVALAPLPAQQPASSAQPDAGRPISLAPVPVAPSAPTRPAQQPTPAAAQPAPRPAQTVQPAPVARTQQQAVQPQPVQPQPYPVQQPRPYPAQAAVPPQYATGRAVPQAYPAPAGPIPPGTIGEAARGGANGPVPPRPVGPPAGYSTMQPSRGGLDGVLDSLFGR
ncbi:PBP1A family penicillin-binding protein [Methyloraptor flagellatus]|uniref:PBP1A family penicillin-binding protein n=1 Tax=Methyloraptor flagellatus TaxID=3162530 RepID=A0AAU7X7V3_9HYPH